MKQHKNLNVSEYVGFQSFLTAIGKTEKGHRWRTMQLRRKLRRRVCAERTKKEEKSIDRATAWFKHRRRKRSGLQMTKMPSHNLVIYQNTHVPIYENTLGRTTKSKANSLFYIYTSVWPALSAGMVYL